MGNREQFDKKVETRNIETSQLVIISTITKVRVAYGHIVAIL